MVILLFLWTLIHPTHRCYCLIFLCTLKSCKRRLYRFPLLIKIVHLWLVGLLGTWGTRSGSLGLVWSAGMVARG